MKRRFERRSNAARPTVPIEWPLPLHRHISIVRPVCAFEVLLLLFEVALVLVVVLVVVVEVLRLNIVDVVAFVSELLFPLTRRRLPPRPRKLDDLENVCFCSVRFLHEFVRCSLIR